MTNREIFLKILLPILCVLAAAGIALGVYFGVFYKKLGKKDGNDDNLTVDEKLERDFDFELDESGTEIFYVVKSLKNNKISALEIPVVYKGVVVKEIAPNAFAGNNKITSISIADSIVTIGDNAFKNCQSVDTLVLGATTKNIGNNAFFGCKNIEILVIPESVENIGEQAFGSCTALKQVLIENFADGIDDTAFNGDLNIQLVNIKKGNVGACFSYKDKLETVLLGEGVVGVGANAFVSCSKLTSIVLPASIDSLGEKAFTSGISSVTFSSDFRWNYVYLNPNCFESWSCNITFNIHASSSAVGQVAKSKIQSLNWRHPQNLVFNIIVD